VRDNLKRIKMISQTSLGRISHEENDLISNELIARGNLEPHMVEQFVKYINKTSVVFDLGANIGLHTILFGRIAKKVFAFEPYSVNFKHLQFNLRENKISNALVFQLGLSDKQEDVRVKYLNPINSGQVILDNNPNHALDNWENMEEKIIVKCVTLDSLNIDELHFLKIDVEGYESKVLAGGEKTIRTLTPVIAIEDWIGTSLPILESWGYSITKIEDPPHVKADYMAIFNN
jgi:FkbM family methyltransferase